MKWSEAQQIIAEKMLVGSDLNTCRSTLRKIIGVGHKCWKYDYSGEDGFLVRISNYEINNLDIPWSMLEKCFAALQNSGYNGKVFRECYPIQAKDHPCHVHVVGMIFKKSGVAVSDADEMNYFIASEF
jgi:hypothetical protein